MGHCPRILKGSISVFPVPAHPASLSLAEPGGGTTWNPRTPACSESCAQHSGWTHTLHFSCHWTGMFKGPGAHVLTIAPSPGVMHMCGTREEQGREREARAEGGPLWWQAPGVGLHVETAISCLPLMPWGTGGPGLRRPSDALRPVDLISCSHNPTPMMIDESRVPERVVRTQGHTMSCSSSECIALCPPGSDLL